jgi:hypothetical protein
MQAFIFSSVFMGEFSRAKALLLRGESDRLARGPHGVRQPTQRRTLYLSEYAQRSVARILEK